MNKNMKKQKGGCGCQKSTDVNDVLTGGSNNPHVNPVNTYENDPNSPSSVVSTRIQPNVNFSSFLSGGKKRKTKKQKTRTKKQKTKTKKRKTRTKKQTKTHQRNRNIKIKGGSDYVLDYQNANVVSSFNTVLGTPASSHVITGTNDSTMNSETKFFSQAPFI